MPRSAANRQLPGTSAVPAAARKVYGLTAQKKRRHELDDLGPIERITKADIIVLRDLCKHESARAIAEKIGVHESVMLRAMCGLGEQCIPRTTEALRLFLDKLNS